MRRDIHAAQPSRTPLRDLLPDVTGRHSKFRSHLSQQSEHTLTDPLWGALTESEQDEAKRKRDAKAAERLELERARAAVKTEPKSHQHVNKRRRSNDDPEPT